MSKLDLACGALKFKENSSFRLSVLVWTFIGFFIVFLGFLGELIYFLLVPEEKPSWWGIISVLIVVAVSLLVITVFMLHECSKISKSKKKNKEGQRNDVVVEMKPRRDVRIEDSKFYYEDDSHGTYGYY